MIKKILGTILTRIGVALITLATVLINGWFLGAEKVGTISLIMLAITLIQMINGFVGGSSLVYLLPRTDLVKLFLPSCIWSIFISFAGSLVIGAFHLIPDGYFWDVVILSLILSLATVNFMVLTGQERIRAFNFISIFQAATFFIVLIFWLFILEKREVYSYLVALYISYFLAFGAGLILVLKGVRWGTISGMKQVLRDVFHYGSVMQAGNVIQFLNYRLSYYFTEFFMGRAALGVYSVGVQLSESVWLISRSIHLVQYARISNENDPAYAARLTLSLAKIAFLVTLVCLVALFLLLLLVFPFIFKPEFAGLKWVMASLSLGILIFSLSIVLSPFFSGMGKPFHNTVSAAIGLVFTLISGLLLIPGFGLVGAGFSATISYAAATLYQFIIFIRVSHIRPKEFLLTKADIHRLLSELKQYLSDREEPITEPGSDLP